MGLDIYAGTLTRYSLGEWELIAAKVAREAGLDFQVVRARPEPEDAITDPAEVEAAWGHWRERLNEGLVEAGAEPLEWNEGLASPYDTDKPDWDGYGSLVTWAAHLDDPSLPLPDEPRREWTDDEALMKALHAPENLLVCLSCELWLPGAPDVIEFEWPAVGEKIRIGGLESLVALLMSINERSWSASRDDVRLWRKRGPFSTKAFTAKPSRFSGLPLIGAAFKPRLVPVQQEPSGGLSPFELSAQHGFACFYELAEFALTNRVALRLDY